MEVLVLSIDLRNPKALDAFSLIDLVVDFDTLDTCEEVLFKGTSVVMTESETVLVMGIILEFERDLSGCVGLRKANALDAFSLIELNLDTFEEDLFSSTSAVVEEFCKSSNPLLVVGSVPEFERELFRSAGSLVGSISEFNSVIELNCEEFLFSSTPAVVEAFCRALNPLGCVGSSGASIIPEFNSVASHWRKLMGFVMLLADLEDLDLCEDVLFRSISSVQLLVVPAAVDG